VKNLEFSTRAEEDMAYWVKKDRKLAQRIVRLLEEVVTHPFAGAGKPELLKHELSGCWSRRINKEHRLVYKSEGKKVVILSCRYHYE
jgi:toxin YoeB